MKVRAEMGVSGHARWFERLLSELLFFQLFMPWVAVLTRISRRGEFSDPLNIPATAFGEVQRNAEGCRR
jgi:hypothetical protein